MPDTTIVCPACRAAGEIGTLTLMDAPHVFQAGRRRIVHPRTWRCSRCNLVAPPDGVKPGGRILTVPPLIGGDTP